MATPTLPLQSAATPSLNTSHDTPDGAASMTRPILPSVPGTRHTILQRDHPSTRSSFGKVCACVYMLRMTRKRLKVEGQYGVVTYCDANNTVITTLR
ncbi:hypothetical protein SAMD00023353_2000630 [Rosellinia necatrix]|uniref:Uncharacterized protein n=1 Tax=Rosellinia necatrix TaxID=77044 RepID=A0A1S8A7V6_ROSNE|nr:hypothetical protein SAMD00023353_2000630 [Rosellinia necatrix]